MSFNRHLATADFDNTTFLTSKPTPHNYTIQGIYTIAIDAIMGYHAAESFRQTGLQNRAPIEVTKSLAPDALQKELIAINQQITDKRLEILLGEVGAEWPEPTAGYVKFHEQLERSQGTDLPVDLALVSSGHKEFIERVYETAGLETPNIVVVQETLPNFVKRFLTGTPPQEDLVKPSRYLLDITVKAWLSEYGMPELDMGFDLSQFVIAYAGDDPNKDGRLARNAGVPFVHIGETKAVQRRSWEEFWNMSPGRVASRMVLSGESSYVK
jgi:hypothetical protein